MNPLHARRAPWVMLAVFCISALGLFFMTTGGDLELLDDLQESGAAKAVSREVRMPIVLEKYESLQKELKKDIKKPIAMVEKALKPQVSAAKAPKEAEAPIQRPETSPAAADAGQKGNLLSHHFRSTGNGFESIFRMDRSVSGTTLFFKPSPAMWVVDLPGSWTNRAPRINNFDQGPIGRVIIGEHDTFLRVVFHYRDKDRPRPEQAPSISEEKNGLRVLIP